MEDCVKSFYDPNKDIWGDAQIYRGIAFHPIKLKDADSQSIFYSVFQIPKKYINDESIQKMSYLRFLVQIIQAGIDPKGKTVQTRIIKLLENITGKSVRFETNLPDNLTGFWVADYIKIIIDNIEFTENDFDVIREIILLQSGLSTRWVEEYLPDLEQKLIESNGGTDNLTNVEEIFKFCSLLRIPVTSIGDYTLYQFSHHFQEQALLYNNELYSPLEVSGQIKSKNGGELIKPYFTHLQEKGRYGSILTPWSNLSQLPVNSGGKQMDTSTEKAFEDFEGLFNK